MQKQNIKKLSWKIITTVVVTLTAVFTVWVYAAFIEPTIGPNDLIWEQDFAQNILGANNADNSFDSSSVAANNDGSIIERLEYLAEGLNITECGESTTSNQTNCYVDDTVRYLTTNLCDSAKENQCFIPTDNGYYALDTECADSTTTTKTNCYIDDTAKYVETSICSAASNSGYCYMNTATFSAMDADLVASKIKNGVTIFGVSGTYASAESNPEYTDLMHIATFVEPSVAPGDFTQDFTQNIIGANNADNDFDSSNVFADNNGSVIQRLEYLADRKASNARFFASECSESTTTTQTNCYVDDTARYLTTDLCNEAKENSCFVPTDNGYYSFGSECSDSTTTTATNCYVDDTAKYITASICSDASNNGYCFINTANFSDKDTDLVASNIKNGVTIFGVAGTYKLANGAGCSSAAECISGYCADGVCCNTACSGSTCQRCDAYSVSGAGTCGYVSSSAQDPDNECAQGSTQTDGCKSNNCSGSSYSCGVQSSGDGGCPVCQTCTNSDMACEYYGQNSTDVTAPNTCTGTGKYCNGSGSCVTCSWGVMIYDCSCQTSYGSCCAESPTTAACYPSINNQYRFKSSESCGSDTGPGCYCIYDCSAGGGMAAGYQCTCNQLHALFKILFQRDDKNGKLKCKNKI